MSLALLFSPQGSQAVGMGRALAEASDVARRTYAEADDALGWPVSEISWSGPDERLNDTRQTQPCLLTASVAALRALAGRTGVRPAMVAGHSVGEYAALVAAGVLDFAAALRLVARRGELMAEAGAGGAMSAVLGLDRESVDEVVGTIARPTELVVANDNAPGQIVISGTRDAIESAEEAMRTAGARRCVRLPVSGAFHSPLMAPVAEALVEAFAAETWRDPTLPVVSNVTAEPETDASRIRALLAEQVRSPVEWVRSVRRMVDAGVDTVVECGSGAALVGMVSRISPDLRSVAVHDPASLEQAAQLLAGAGAPVA